MTGLRTIVPKYVFLVLIALGWAFGAVAEPLFQFHTLTKKDGLSSSVVFDVVQDHQGFIWLATEDGLQRYDGVQLVTYRHNRLDESSLSNNYVKSLMIDKSGVLWVGTENGLNIYQKDFDNFIRIKHNKDDKNSINANNIRSLYQTSDGTIWVGTIAGLNSIDNKTRRIKSYPHLKVRVLLEDDRRQLLVGTLRGGLYSFDRVYEKFIPLNDVRAEPGSEDLKSLNESSIIDIFQDSYGRIFVATWGDGVFLLERDIKKLIPYSHPLPSKYVRAIAQDSQGQLWFGTKDGILVIEPTRNSEKLIRADDRHEHSLVGDNIQTIFQGQDNTIWVGTYGGGVSRHYPESQRFETYGLHPDFNEGLIDPVVYALHENTDGNIWVGSETGKLALFDSFTKKFKHFPLIIDGVESSSVIRSLNQISREILLIGTSEGLLRYNISTGVVATFDSSADHFLSSPQTVMFIESDNQKRIWIGINGKGLSVYRLNQNGQLVKFPNLVVKSEHPRKVIHLETGESIYTAQKQNVLRLLVQDNKDGSVVFEKKEVKNTSELSIIDIDVDWENRLWLGVWSSGVKVLAPNDKLISIDETSGLPNDSIYAVVSDPISQRIWVSSNLGITAINPENFELDSFSSADGLQGNEFNLPGIKASTGYLYFGGVNGFNRFYPSIRTRDLYVRPPSLLTLSIANQEVKVSSDGLLPKSLIVTEELNLNYDQTPFSFEFTSPQFVEPGKLQFRYRLLGLSEKWISSNAKDRRATYTNIGAGEYTFELKVGTASGGWGNTIKRLNLRINPPWWATDIAYSIYSLLFLMLVSLIISLSYRKRKKESLIQQAIKENEERLKLSLWGSGYEFWDWNLDSGDISRSNEFRKIQIDCKKLSRNLHELASYIHPKDLEMVREKLSNHIAGNSKYFDICYRVIDANNGWRWIQDRGKVVALDNEGNALRMSGTQRDITNIRERDEQFEMLGQAFKSTSDGVWIRDHEWRLVECNPAFERITGFSLGEKKGETLWFPEIQEQPENLIQRIRISIEEKGNWQGEAWAERKNNDPFPQKLSIDTLHDEKGNIRYYVGVFSDITFHKRTEEEFRKLANYDSLTGLPNRACLYDRLNQTIEKTKRDNGRFALFLVDIDNFKRINDSLGHNVGDHLIRQVASRLVNCNKEGDTVARVGGDEFVIVMESIKSSASVATFSQLLLKELNQPIFVRGQKLKLNFSIGVTLAPDDAIVGERLIRNADTAMYEAKKSVENSYRFYAVEFNERARKRLALENALRKAIEDDSIELFYQPKIDLSRGTVDGVEALARWTHKELGFISPAEFIPLAEETGLVIPLGRQLLRMAIRQTKQWVEQGIMHGRTSVNLSAQQFWNRNFAAEASEILEEECLDARYIELEITESACMQDIEETKSQIKILKELGFSLALDDFGTGYSSLAQLKALPFDTIKVDKSFVDNIETDKQDAKVVKAIIDIAKTMEMEVVIEGVESKRQCEYLWMHRAFMVQGFYFSRPVRASFIPELFARTWHKQEYLGKLASNVTPLG